jgi:hypothetical protein
MLPTLCAPAGDRNGPLPAVFRGKIKDMSNDPSAYRICNRCHERSVPPDVVPSETFQGDLVLACPHCEGELLVARVSFLRGKVE